MGCLPIPCCSFQFFDVVFPELVSVNLEELTDDSGDGEGGGGSREDYSAEDVEYYFNYSGILAEQGSYDQLEDLLECEFFSTSYASCIWLAPLIIARLQPSYLMHGVPSSCANAPPSWCLH